MTAWREANSPGDTTTGSLQTNEQRDLPEELSVIMAVLTGGSLGEKTCMMMDREIMQPKKDGYERGFPLPPQRWLITAEVRRSMGAEGGRDGQSWGRMDEGEGRASWLEEGRRQMESGVMVALRVTGTERGRKEGVRWVRDGPRCGEGVLERWIDGWRGSSSNYRPCCVVEEMEELLFQHRHSALTQQNEKFSH